MTYIVTRVAVDIHLAGLVLCGRLALAHVFVLCAGCVVVLLTSRYMDCLVVSEPLNGILLFPIR